MIRPKRCASRASSALSDMARKSRSSANVGSEYPNMAYLHWVNYTSQTVGNGISEPATVV